MLINSNGQNSNRIDSEWSLCMVKAGTGFVTLFHMNNIFDRSFAKILGRICVFARVWIDNGACMALVAMNTARVMNDLIHVSIVYHILISYGICILLDIYFFLFTPMKTSSFWKSFIYLCWFSCALFARVWVRSLLCFLNVILFSRINNVAYFAVVAFPSCSFLPFSS